MPATQQTFQTRINVCVSKFHHPGSLKKFCFSETESENSIFISFQLRLLYTLSRLTQRSLTGSFIHSFNKYVKKSLLSLYNTDPMVDRITLPKDVQALTPRTCEYVTFPGKRDFADMIMGPELETKRLYYINPSGPNLITQILKMRESIPAVVTKM